MAWPSLALAELGRRRPLHMLFARMGSQEEPLLLWEQHRRLVLTPALSTGYLSRLGTV